jgi:DNA polymerase-4
LGEKRAVILHVDMDAFFASVENADHPEWRGKPLVVGGLPDERGVVSTCSYEARKFGIHSAMPLKIAYERCPKAIFVRPRMSRYQEISNQVFEVFSHYSPFVEAVSIDEAFIDISGTVHLYGCAEKLGEALRREVFETCKVTCSVGIAKNRLLAKIGSEINKPNGLKMMPEDDEEIARFLASRKIGILWGIGKKTEELLNDYGIRICKDIQELSIESLATVLGSEDAARQLKEYSLGISDANVYWQAAKEKSVSREYTFDADCWDIKVVREKLLELVTDVGRRFRTEKRWAKTAKLKLRDAKFNTVTRQVPFRKPSRDDFSFREKAIELFEREKIVSVRLIGFGVTNIVESRDDGVPNLFADREDERLISREKLSAALDDLHNRGLM